MIVTMGSVVYEVVVRTDELPTTWDQRQVCSQGISGTAGGSAGNIAVIAARLGCPVRHIGKVAGVPWAALLQDFYAAAGVDTRWLAVVNAPQPSMVVLLVNAEGNWTVFAARNPATEMGPEDIDERAVAGATYVVVDGYSLFNDRQRAAADRLFTLARAHGARLVVDASTDLAINDPQYLRSLAARCDLFFANEREMLSVTAAPDLGTAIERMSQLGAQIAVLKAGTRGALAVCSDGSIVWAPAYATQVTDTVGAGDGLVAGTLVGLHRGLSLARALQVGTATAALVCRGSGSLSYAFTWSDVAEVVHTEHVILDDALLTCVQSKLKGVVFSPLQAVVP